MRLLLDTHVLLWWATADRRLTRTVRQTIASADNDVSISSVTFWEIAIKSALGRIDVDLAELHAAVNADGLEEVPVRISHALRVQSLPDHHRDPFDRMLIAQSIVEGRRLMTRDERILEYAGVAGFDPLPA